MLGYGVAVAPPLGNLKVKGQLAVPPAGMAGRAQLTVWVPAATEHVAPPVSVRQTGVPDGKPFAARSSVIVVAVLALPPVFVTKRVKVAVPPAEVGKVYEAEQGTLVAAAVPTHLASTRFAGVAGTVTVVDPLEVVMVLVLVNVAVLVYVAAPLGNVTVKAQVAGVVVVTPVLEQVTV